MGGGPGAQPTRRRRDELMLASDGLLVRSLLRLLRRWLSRLLARLRVSSRLRMRLHLRLLGCLRLRMIL